MVEHRSASGNFEVAFDLETGTLRWTCKDPARGVDVIVRTGFGTLDPAVMAHVADLQAAVASPTDASPSAAASVAVLARRAYGALDYLAPRLVAMAHWTVAERELTNFTYALSDRNRGHLAHLVARATGAPLSQIRALMTELDEDAVLIEDLKARSGNAADPLAFAATPRFGRRIGWYVLTRLTKPGLVVEAGVDKGLGSALLCRALERNAAEGRLGEYLGIDINPAAGFLLGGAWSRWGQIAVGDSLEVLAGLGRPVDLFISDSDHSPEFEAKEYRAVAPHLSARAIVIADNAHSSDALMAFAEATGRPFLYLREEPEAHWYPGASIALALPPV
jgi:hypothetical protein